MWPGYIPFGSEIRGRKLAEGVKRRSVTAVFAFLGVFLTLLNTISLIARDESTFLGQVHFMISILDGIPLFTPPHT